MNKNKLMSLLVSIDGKLTMAIDGASELGLHSVSDDLTRIEDELNSIMESIESLDTEDEVA